MATFKERWRVHVVVDDGIYLHNKVLDVAVFDKGMAMSTFCEATGYEVTQVVKFRAQFKGIVAVEDEAKG